MRTTVKGFVIAVFAAAILALVTATPSEARKRPPNDNIDVCTSSAGQDKGCEGAICWCCYTDGPEKGCWICDHITFGNCKWDPGYQGLKSRGVTLPGQGGVLQPLTTVPPGVVKPPVVAPSKEAPLAR